MGERMTYLEWYLVRRLLRTGHVQATQEPSQAAFDEAYEADIMAIVLRVLKSQGLTE